MAGQRDVSYHPAPIYDMPGFSVANLPRSYTVPVVLLDAVTTDPTTSALFSPGSSEGFELTVETTEGITADVSVLDEDDTVVANVPGAGHGKQFSISWFDQRLEILGKQFKVKVENFSAAGAVTVKYNPQ